jgi:proteasome accessory factor A
MRFGELSGRGIFRTLDAAGVLAHRVPGVDPTGAVDTAPDDTRAHVRAAVVRRLTAARTRYRAEWTRIVDLDHERQLDLGDPFELEERWAHMPQPSERAS